ncbi:MAG: CHAD domain-containing protein [Pseudomonadales bacterium]|nr:CHAD domain-containing protein [Pseudomonadales bacterium]
MGSELNKRLIVSRQDCIRCFNDKLTSFRRKLSRYVRDPDHKSIHDVRTSFRRLNIAYDVLPRSCRTDDSEIYLHDARQFFNLNSQIRDWDVISLKLQAYGLSEKGKILRWIKGARKKQLKQAMKIALALNAQPRPKIDKNNSPKLNPLPMHVNKRALRFLSNQQLILADSSNKEELHSMRKDAKKLFYLLEMDNSLASAKQMSNIKMFQRLTGEIHDCDVAEIFLEEQGNAHTELHLLLTQERATRTKYYLELCEFLSDGKWQSLANLGKRK